MPRDISVIHHGSVVEFSIRSGEARDWVREHVHIEDWQWIGRDSFAVDHRLAYGLIEGMQDAGLEVG